MRTAVPTYLTMPRAIRLLSVAALLAFSSLIGSCRSADPVTPGPNEQPIVRTTLAGTVVDESGMPVSGASVTAHGLSTTTDEYGYFILHNVSAPQDRCVALAKADGYFTSAKAATTLANGLTEVQLFMQSHGTRKVVSGTSGGTLSVTSPSGTASVAFAPNGLVTRSGTSFTGDAQVAIKHLDPADPSFANFFSGDQAATRTDGTRTDLISYGVLRVDIRSSSGEELQPAPGKPATLSYPIAAGQSANAPATMPLWFFDESKGMWVEEGVATKQGNVYLGTVTHFTDWNCDKPTETNADLTIIVRCNQMQLPGVNVKIGYEGATWQLSGYTGETGAFMRLVPAGIPLTVHVDGDDNNMLYYSNIMDIGVLGPREQKTVTIDLTSPCPTMIKGVLTDAEDRDIAGRVTWVMDNGKVHSVTSLDGKFGMVVPSNTELDLIASTWACMGSKEFTVTSGDASQTTDIGRVVACGVEEPVTGDIDVSAFGDSTVYVALSPDGSNVAVYGNAPVVVVRKTADGLLTSSSNLGGTSQWHYASDGTFSSDGSRFSISDQAQNPGLLIFETATGNRIATLDLREGRLTPDGLSAIGYRITTNQEYQLTKLSVATGDVEQVYNTGTVQYARLLGISSDGSRAVVMAGNRLIVHDLINNAVLYDHEMPAKELFWGQQISMSADARVVSTMAWTTNGIAIMVINTETGAILREINTGSTNRYEIANAISADGTAIVMQEITDNTTFSAPKVISVATGEVLSELSLQAEPGYFKSFSFSRNGNKLAGIYSLNGKTMVRIWNM